MPHATDANAPRPISRVNATRPARFIIGRTDRSCPSIIRARTTTTTPVSEFSCPNSSEKPITKRTIRAKNTVLPARVLRFMHMPRFNCI